MATLKLNRPIEIEVHEYAVVAHPTDSEWRPYLYLDDEWYEINDGPGYIRVTTHRDVQRSIDDDGFQVVFEGVPR